MQQFGFNELLSINSLSISNRPSKQPAPLVSQPIRQQGYTPSCTPFADSGSGTGSASSLVQFLPIDRAGYRYHRNSTTVQPAARIGLVSSLKMQLSIGGQTAPISGRKNTRNCIYH